MKPTVVNGWTIFYHPLFIDQLEDLVSKVELLKEKSPDSYKNSNLTKRLAAVEKLTQEIIPLDPTRSEYRQGKTLGDEYKHWFRAKFFQQYRLFFRFHQESKIIIYAWVNDDKTKRAYDSKTDAYTVFKKMLVRGCPPNSFNQLLEECK